MRRRDLVWGFAGGLASWSSTSSAKATDFLSLLRDSQTRGEYLHLEITQLLLSAQLLLLMGNKEGARQTALQLVPLSQRDAKWFTYAESFQLCVILVQTTDRNDRQAWVFANRGVLECFPGMKEGDTRENYRTVAKAGYDLLVADSAGPPQLSPDYRGRVAALLLVVSSVAPGRERTSWAQAGRRETLRSGTAALSDWSVDNITPRFAAAGIAISGDWKTASTEYEKAILASTGAMPRLVTGPPRTTVSGLAGTIAGATTLEAEAATAFAMGGRLNRAIEVLETSRRNTGAKRRSGATAGSSPVLSAQQLEERLTSIGVVVVQPVTSLIGAFALVSVRRKGKLQRFTAFDPVPGGVELFCRMIASKTPQLFKDGLAPTYQRVRKARGTDAQKKMIAYVARASADAELLTGATIRRALQSANVTAQEDVLVVLPANLALLPISLCRTATAAPLGQSYQLRFSDSLLTGWTSEQEARRLNTQPPTVAILSEDDSSSGLRFLAFETACVAANFPEAGRKRIRPVGKAPISLSSLDGSKYWHVANHAAWDFRNPDRSGVSLSRKQVASLADIHALSVNNRPRLVFLSACETSLINIEKNLDEFTGLLTAFLGVGAAGAIGSLWPVSDVATSLFSARFYDDHIQARGTPGAALRRAQQWLQASSTASLRAYVTEKVVKGQIAVSDAAEIAAYLLEQPGDVQPFKDPYFWAGFQLYGC